MQYNLTISVKAKDGAIYSTTGKTDSTTKLVELYEHLAVELLDVLVGNETNAEGEASITLTRTNTTEYASADKFAEALSFITEDYFVEA